MTFMPRRYHITSKRLNGAPALSLIYIVVVNDDSLLSYSQISSVF